MQVNIFVLINLNFLINLYLLGNPFDKFTTLLSFTERQTVESRDDSKPHCVNYVCCKAFSSQQCPEIPGCTIDYPVKSAINAPSEKRYFNFHINVFQCRQWYIPLFSLSLIFPYYPYLEN